MEWKDRGRSDNMEDARGQGGGGGFGGMGGGGFGLLTMIGRVFGFKGILVAVVAGFLLWHFGIINPAMLVGGGSDASAENRVETPEEKERYEFVGAVLKGTEEVWTREFSRHGLRYVDPKLVVYHSRVQTACGNGSSAMGPFYCPGDQKVYIDLTFFDELARTFNSPDDFAQAYVIAHEVGHHVQKLLGTSDRVSAMRGRPDYNQYSVRLELQADFYAGMWAKQSIDYFRLSKEDIEEAMRAANAIGDDAIQKQSQGKVVPHAFTHGTSEQRTRWFMKGFNSGRMEEGDTFSMAYEDL